MCVCYLALSWAAASLAAFSLAAELGLRPGTAVKVLIIAAIAAVTLAISVCGHATIVKLYLPFTVALTAVFAVLATSLYTGPVARAAGGADLSLPAGILVSAAVYLVMMRSRRTAALRRAAP